MAVCGVDCVQWSYMLAPQLTGKAQKTFAAIEDDQISNYEGLKAAILKRYDMNKKAYRQQLCSVTKRNDKTHQELATRVLELTHKWLQECKTVGEVLEAAATEQLLISMAEDVRVWYGSANPRPSQRQETSPMITFRHGRASGRVWPGRRNSQ